MFWHFYHYRLKVLLRNKSLLFWTLAFPILLGAMFTAAFSGIDQIDQMETRKIAVVAEDQEKAASFVSVLEEIKNEDSPLFTIEELGLNEANEQLEKEEIAGFYTVDSREITLSVANTGISQTLMKTVLDQYLQSIELSSRLLDSGGIQPNQLTADFFANQNFVKEKKTGGTISLKSFYFFTLVGMSILYGFMWGLRNAQDQQANQSANGIRLSLIPKNKLFVSIANLCAGFTVFFLEILILLAVYHFVYQADFGSRWQWILVVAAIGSANAIILGTIFGNGFVKLTLPQKESLAVSVTMIMSFFSGMMGSQQIKY